MDLTLSHCFIQVHDQDKTLPFYRDILGLELRVDAQLEDFRWLTVGPPSQPEIEIGDPSGNMVRFSGRPQS